MSSNIDAIINRLVDYQRKVFDGFVCIDDLENALQEFEKSNKQDSDSATRLDKKLDVTKELKLIQRIKKDIEFYSKEQKLGAVL